MIQEAIADFILSMDSLNVSQKTQEQSKMHILDTVGVILSGSRDEIGTALRSYLEVLDKGATVLGWGIKTTLADAALTNATFAHALDYDDSSWHLIGHPSAVILPAILALAERETVSGKKLLNAYLLGTEVSCKIGGLTEPKLYENGWHATSAVGVFGAASACAYLLGLDKKKIINALGVAASSACGLRQNFGSMTKPLHAGLAASNGLRASLLAQGGFTASNDAMEGKGGYFYDFAKGIDINSTIEFGRPWDVDDPGFFVKPYPSCAASHTGIDAILELRSEHGFKPEDVEKIEVGSAPVGPVMLFYNRPSRGFEGKFCMPFLAAASVLEGKVGLDFFTDEFVRRPDIQAMMDKVNFYVDDRFAGCQLSEAPALVKIYLKDGRVLKKLVEEPKGGPHKHLNKEDFIEKYRDCASRVLPDDKVEYSLNLLLKLEKIISIRHLIDQLTV